MQVEHQTDYAAPVLRAPSPASSVGSQYLADQTSFSDSEGQLSQAAFEQKWMDKLELDQPLDEELEADEDPRVPEPKNEAERKALFEQTMRFLRAKVTEVEENELFEQIIVRNSHIETEPLPTSRDIDMIMRSMMISPSAPPHSTPRHTRVGNVTDAPGGPWLSNGRGAEFSFESTEKRSAAGMSAPKTKVESRRH
ncbi:hypothetical protein HGRIS_006350 [Hohenbuehelia grisea]|uniref:Uncharacterized protein n=1 Tax=Hohenbuehelia grisea TaxID=104357 RepID=A0ABR3JZP0_9AGAR